MASENQTKASPAGTDPVDAVGVLFSFSEWLDDEGLMLSEEESLDTRSHEDLVRDYLIHLHTEASND